MRKSLDEIEAGQFGARSRPMDAEPQRVTLQPGGIALPPVWEPLSLNGSWQMVADGNRPDRVAGQFADAIEAEVPGSVHGALEKVGKIPDPKFGKNDAIAREQSFKNWWYCRRFPRPAMENPRLVFEGVANKCGVFLNGKYLGDHGGMFGGWEVPIKEQLTDDNLLVVRVLPAPYDIAPDEYFPGANSGWQHTVTINNVYGWHYSNIPCLGIWRPVRIEETPTVRMSTPFIAVHDLSEGEVDVAIDFTGPEKWNGRLVLQIAPENFSGRSFHFEQAISSQTKARTVRLRFAIPEAKLWWPNGAGAQNLYRCAAAFVAEGEDKGEVRTTTFGLRTVEMRPLPGGPYPDKYNWTFVINGRPMFVKGTGWCTMDSSLDFSRARYERFLTFAREQHCQMVRAWGSGMPETDDFYDLCDRYGLMVMQEWPTAWNSQKVQPYIQLEETVRQNTLRLRNRPSLVMWGGGNESQEVEDPIIDMMGRLSLELDGTRPFHRGEPRGGSEHNYECWWWKKPLDYNVTMEAPFWGEFGIASTPMLESVLRYLPKQEETAWPPAEDSVFAHHTPVFNGLEDMARLRLYASDFSTCNSMPDLIRASQVAQVVALRHTLERARTRWPDCTGALYYKLNDNYPAVSWSTSDWYGATKMAHFFCRSVFSPVHACVLVPKLNIAGEDVSLPVYLLDDYGALAGQGWKVRVRALNRDLALVREQTFAGKDTVAVRKAGEFRLSAEETNSVPLLLVVDWSGAEKCGRTFYWLNYASRTDCLFRLPKTQLSLGTDGNLARVSNTGTVPAVAVHVLRPGHLDTFSISENYLWLDPGESVEVTVNNGFGLTLSAWNSL